MGAVAFVTFDGFYAACLLRADPGLRGRPLAVVRSRQVLDSSPAARRAGIRPGMADAEARYAARGCRPPVRFTAFEESDYASACRHWLDVCAELTTVIEPVEPHCAFLDLSALAVAREVARPLAADIYEALRVCPRIGVAESRLTARLTAEYGPGDVVLIPDGEDAAFLSPLPVGALWLARPEHLRRLSFLGYRTIGHVAKLPPELLQKQFGQEGLQVSLWARGADRSAVRALYPPDELAARFNFPQPARLDQELEAGLRFLAERLGSVLSSRDKQTAEIELELAFDSGRVRRAKRFFAKPMQSPGALLTGLRLTLRRIEIDAEAVCIFARLPKIEDSGRKQLSVSAAFSTSPLQRTAVEKTLQQLRETFGEDAVKRADEIVVPRRKLVLRAWKGADE